MRKFFTVNGLVISNDVRNFSNKYKDIFFRKKQKKFESVLALPKSTYYYPTGVFPEGESKNI